jgi:DNA polymerase elongation subunit (family B)
MNYITFDIETYNPEQDMSGKSNNKIDTNILRVSVIGAYLSWTNEYIIFFEEEVDDFINLLKKADLVVGFNHIWFDLPVLNKYANFNLTTLNCYDIMLAFESQAGFKIRLNDLAMSNVGASKTDSFQFYRNYHLEGKWYELSDYCIHDVFLTEKLFKKILSSQPLRYTDMLTTREVILTKPSKIKSIENKVEQLF